MKKSNSMRIQSSHIFTLIQSTRNKFPILQSFILKILPLFRLRKNSIESPCVIILYNLLYIEKSDYKKESSWLILMKTI